MTESTTESSITITYRRFHNIKLNFQEKMKRYGDTALTQLNVWKGDGSEQPFKLFFIGIASNAIRALSSIADATCSSFSLLAPFLLLKLFSCPLFPSLLVACLTCGAWALVEGSPTVQKIQEKNDPPPTSVTAPSEEVSLLSSIGGYLWALRRYCPPYSQGHSTENP